MTRPAARSLHHPVSAPTKVSLMRIALLPLLALAAAAPLAAQDTAIVINPESSGVHFTPPELPREIADSAIRFYNAATTTRLVGRTQLPHGNGWRGDVAVRNGPVLLGGRIDGSLLVIDGDLLLAPGAEVTGDVLVVGGAVTGADSARIGGRARAYREPLAYRLAADSLVYAPNLLKRFGQLGAEYAFNTPETRSAITLATGGTFNRVEGIPIVFGPVFDWRIDPRTALRLDALGVFRTAGDLTGKKGDLGYRLHAEIRYGTLRPVSLAFRAYDVVAPVEDWGLHASEVGWAAFLFQRDYRDYYANQGFGVRLNAQIEHPLSAFVEWRREIQRDAPTRDPWTLFRNEQAWRLNPPIDEGHFNTFGFGATLDTRNDLDNPTSGWYVRGSFEHGSSHDVSPATGVPTSVRGPIPTDGSYAYARVFFDARLYGRVSPAGRVDLRMVAGGWAGGDPLPLQRRLSLGGPDPMPGYEFRASGCNHDITDPTFGTSQPAACDRVLLLQGEYRGHISLHWGYNPAREDESPRNDVLFRLEGPDLVVFGDAGQAWNVGNGPGKIPSGQLPTIGSWIADLGLGVDWGGFGVYAAKAVTVGEPIRFTLRLNHRF